MSNVLSIADNPAGILYLSRIVGPTSIGHMPRGQMEFNLLNLEACTE